MNLIGIVNNVFDIAHNVFNEYRDVRQAIVYRVNDQQYDAGTVIGTLDVYYQGEGGVLGAKEGFRHRNVPIINGSIDNYYADEAVWVGYEKGKFELPFILSKGDFMHAETSEPYVLTSWTHWRQGPQRAGVSLATAIADTYGTLAHITPINNFETVRVFGEYIFFEYINGLVGRADYSGTYFGFDFPIVGSSQYTDMILTATGLFIAASNRFYRYDHDFTSGGHTIVSSTYPLYGKSLMATEIVEGGSYDEKQIQSLALVTLSTSPANKKFLHLMSTDQVVNPSTTLDIIPLQMELEPTYLYSASPLNATFVEQVGETHGYDIWRPEGVPDDPIVCTGHTTGSNKLQFEMWAAINNATHTLLFPYDASGFSIYHLLPLWGCGTSFPVYPRTLKQVFQWPQLDRWMPALENASSLTVYKSDGSKVFSKIGWEQHPTTRDFYTPLISHPDGYVLVKTRRLTYMDVTIDVYNSPTRFYEVLFPSSSSPTNDFADETYIWDESLAFAYPAPQYPNSKPVSGDPEDGWNPLIATLRIPQDGDSTPRQARIIVAAHDFFQVLSIETGTFISSARITNEQTSSMIHIPAGGPATLAPHPTFVDEFYADAYYGSDEYYIDIYGHAGPSYLHEYIASEAGDTRLDAKKPTEWVAPVLKHWTLNGDIIDPEDVPDGLNPFNYIEGDVPVAAYAAQISDWFDAQPVITDSAGYSPVFEPGARTDYYEQPWLKSGVNGGFAVEIGDPAPGEGSYPVHGSQQPTDLVFKYDQTMKQDSLAGNHYKWVAEEHTVYGDAPILFDIARPALSSSMGSIIFAPRNVSTSSGDTNPSNFDGEGNFVLPNAQRSWEAEFSNSYLRDIVFSDAKYKLQSRGWVVSIGWDGKEIWRHEIPIVSGTYSVFTNVCCVLGKAVILYQTNSERRVRIINETNGKLISDNLLTVPGIAIDMENFAHIILTGDIVMAVTTGNVMRIEA